MAASPTATSIDDLVDADVTAAAPASASNEQSRDMNNVNAYTTVDHEMDGAREASAAAAAASIAASAVVSTDTGDDDAAIVVSKEAVDLLVCIGRGVVVK